jgi:hypothetical protein
MRQHERPVIYFEDKVRNLRRALEPAGRKASPMGLSRIIEEVVRATILDS